MGSTEDMRNKKGKVFSINLSGKKGVLKKPVKKATLIQDFGLEGDAHGGFGIRQVSLLSYESIAKQTECAKLEGKKINLEPGDFAENITTAGLDLTRLSIGTKLRLGDGVVLEVSKIGKECHGHCAVYRKLGDCIMPREGIFAKVLQGGDITIGDAIEVLTYDEP